MNDSGEPKGGLRANGVRRGAGFTIEVDGRAIPAYEGETVLAVLWAAGIHALRMTAKTGEPRGFFCGMGVCFDCLVTIDGTRNVRSCLEPARPDMRVATQRDDAVPSNHGSPDHAAG